MSQLSRRIQEREGALGAHRRLMSAAASELLAGTRRRAGSMGVLCAAFCGGLVLGWVDGGRGLSDREPNAAPSSVESSRSAFSRATAMIRRFAREVVWPGMLNALRVELNYILGRNGS